jgi:starvation-inducible DNA-binding protein
MKTKNTERAATSGEGAQTLSRVLADTYTLALKTQNFHWNVTGPHFAPLHGQFEAQYDELSDAVDEIAERLRALGRPAPGTFKEFAALARVPDAGGEKSAEEMVRSLRDGHRVAAAGAKAALRAAAAAGDEVTVDLMVVRTAAHDKAAWMLSSFLSE